MVRPKMTKHRGEPGHTLTRTEEGGYTHREGHTDESHRQPNRRTDAHARPGHDPRRQPVHSSLRSQFKITTGSLAGSGTLVARQSPPAALPVYRRLQASRSQRRIRVGWPDDISTERKLNIIYTGRSIMDGREKRQNFFFYSPKNSTSFGTTHRTSGLAPLTTSPP